MSQDTLLLTTHSTKPAQSLTNTTIVNHVVTVKTSIVANLTPPISDNSSHSPLVTTVSTMKQPQKSAQKKIEYKNLNMSTKLNNITKIPKEVTVIVQNTTDINNITDQNVNFTAINHIIDSNLTLTDFNETVNSNQTLLHNLIVDDGFSGNNLTAAGITGITLGCIVIVGVICGISYFLYHNRGFNRPQVLNDRCSNPDSSGYIDDASVRVSSY